MKLKEALEIGGNIAYGVVKCTYTCLYGSETGKALFSVLGEETYYDGAFFRMIDDKRLASGYAVEKHNRLPIVIADESELLTSVALTHERDRIRVRFTEEFRVGLEDYLNGIKDIIYFKLIEETKSDYTDKNGKVHKKGEKRVMMETYDFVNIASENAYFKEAYKDNARRTLYWIDSSKELSERYEKLLQIASTNDYIYVLARNLDWTPADMVITFVDDRNTMASYEAELKAAQEKVEQAKRLLIASGLASLII